MKKILTLFVFCISFLGFTQEQEIIDLDKQAAQYVRQKNYEQAAKTYQLVIDNIRNNFESIHKDYIWYLNTLGDLYSGMKQYQKALPLYLESLNLTRKELGESHRDYTTSLSYLAVTYQLLGKYEKALPLFIEGLENTKKTVGKKNEWFGEHLNNLANLYRDMEQYEKAIPLYLESLENIKITVGKQHSKYEARLNKLALLYELTGQYEKAVPIYLEAKEISEIKVGEKGQDYLKYLDNLAELYKKMEQYEKAILIYTEASEIIEEMLGKEHSDYRIRLNNLADLYKEISCYEKALAIYLKVLENTEQTLGKKHSDYGVDLFNLAGLYETIGQYEKALPLYLESLENAKKTFGKEHIIYGVVLNNLASLYFEIGQYKKAVPLFNELLKNSENTLGKDHSSYNNYLNNLASLYTAKGDYEKALQLYLEAIENTKKTLGKEHPDYGVLLAGLANLYTTLGQYEKALPNYIEALENTEKSIGKYNSVYGSRLNNLANLYRNMGQYKKALPLNLEFIENTKKSLGKEHSTYGLSLGNLGNLYLKMNEYEKALPLYLEALENAEKTQGKEHSNYGTSLNNLGLLYKNMELYEKALPLYLKALENVEESFGKQHSKYGASLSNLAVLYKSMGLYQKAFPLLIEENKNIKTQIKQNFSFQDEGGKEKFVENILGSGLNQFQQFNFTTNNYYPESLSLATNNILLGKGLLLNASKNILTKLEGLNDKNINEKIVLFKSKKAFINQQLQISINKRVPNYITEKENLESIERELVTLYSQHFNEEINYIKNWKNTQLKENDIAIEFTHFYVNKDSTMYAAYLYKKDWKTPKVVNLFEEKQLTKYFSISNNPNDLYKSRGTITKSNTAQLALADGIYKLVWKPLEKYVDSSSTIYFSPDGLLHKIPFAALPNTNNKLIGELYDIQQMGNTADIRTNTKQPNLNDVLLIGGVKYEYKIDSSKKKKEFTTSILESEELLGKKENRSISRNGFEYLEGTELEINKIDSLLGGSKQLSGYEATETAFKKLSGNSPSVLHIATHGFFFKKPKEEQKQNELLGQQNSYKLHKNPLLRSGLLFANANYAWQNGNNPYEEDDGILTALEISNLDLKNTDIVILSACETGLGDIEGSEGVYGLQRAFKMAGVKAIIMSLWPVPDKETAEFMNLFYTKWKSYNNAKKAFKETQQFMMQKYRDEPQKWAAFVYFE